MDALNRLFIKASADGVLQPLGVHNIKYHCSMYADDVILLAAPMVGEARAISRILELFGDASGLRPNLDKCSITPIFGCEGKLEDFQATLPCAVQQFPITYLGVPLSTKALPKSQYLPPVEKVAAKLPTWQGPLMNKSGRLTLVKSTLSSMPVYLSMSDKLPPWVIKQLDGIRRNFLWTGKDTAVRGKNVVAWPTVCRPTIYGGLGVVDLKLAGYALRTRWLWLQKVDEGRSWSALQIHIEPEVQAFFRASIMVNVGNGQCTLFWTDNWIDGQSVAQLAPTLHEMISKRIRNSRTVSQALLNRRWTQDIRGGRTVQGLVEYIDLWERMPEIILDQGREDTFRWRWTVDAPGCKVQLGSGTVGHHLKSNFSPGWQLSGASGLPTVVDDTDLMHMISAGLCDQEDETSDHILVNCVYAKDIWWGATSWMD
ncbi:uncharacterized protein [Setaria viridis]|uniref:uncharacterized protein n=1 Tax=Setaria viridis TaxID=4556 RepID=UPI003B3AA2CB